MFRVISTVPPAARTFPSTVFARMTVPPAACTLPFTGVRCVNLIVTEKAVIEVTPQGLLLREIASDTTLDAVTAATGAPLLVPSPPASLD